MRIARVVIPLFVVGAAIVALWLHSTAEPRVGGKSLTRWLDQEGYAALNETQRLTHARGVLLAAPQDRVQSHLLRLVSAEDGPLRLWAMGKSEKLKLASFNWRAADEREEIGLVGYELLATNAAAAVGPLMRMLDDPQHSVISARCLEAIGKPAEAALCRCLTNQNTRVRSIGITSLATMMSDVAVYLDRMRDGLKDPSPDVRVSAVEAIASQPEAFDLTIPLLLAALTDRDETVASRAISGLGSFGTNAVGAFPILSNLACCGNARRANAALLALPMISPGAALFIASNVVVHGDTKRLGLALGVLQKVAPELAWQMEMAALHGTNPSRRYEAVSALATFDAETAGVVEELKVASNDRDPEVARRAARATERMSQKQTERRRKSGIPLELPGDPGYEGRTLGVWMKMLADPETTTNAAAALQHMGTNVVPALLSRLTYRDPLLNHDDQDIGLSALIGFLALTEQQARAALPALGELMDGSDEDVVSRAMLASCAAGTNAFPFLVKGMSSHFPGVRSEAAGVIFAAWGEQHPEYRRIAMPLLWNLLNDPDQSVRATATKYLKEFDPRAAARAGIK